MSKVVALCTLAALLAATAGASSQPPLAGDDSWPQWRGHGRAGIGAGTSYPDAWSATDRIAWKVQIPGRGHSSPVVWGNRVYVTTSAEGEHLPGRTAPDHLGYDLLPGYLHPDSVGVDSRHALKVLAIRRHDGRAGLGARELYRTEGTRSHPIPSFVAGHGLVFATAGSQAKVVLAIRPGVDGEVDGSRVAWRHHKGTAYVASPILYGDYLYLLSDAGIVTCLDARTGRLVYEGGRVPVPATFRASPVAFGDRILLTSEDGDTFVLRAGPLHEIVRTNSIDEPVWASPALANGMVFLRGARHLFAIR